MRNRLTAVVLSGLMVLGAAACSSDAADDTAPADAGVTAPAGDTGTTTGGDTGTTTGGAAGATDPALGDPALEPTE